MDMSFGTNARFSRLGMVAAGLLAAPAALARPADCEAVQNAFNAVSDVPGYRQSVDMPGSKVESVVVGETIYAHVDGKWTKIRLRPGGRKGILQTMMSISQVFDCKELRSETLPAGRAKVYEYMMTPPKGLPGVPDQPVKHTVWVGVDDGLIHRMHAGDMKIELDFRKQIPPIP